MERLWSYLRRFSRMTKEMRPSHPHIDVLTSALVYYGMQRKEKLGVHFSKFHCITYICTTVCISTFILRLLTPCTMGKKHENEDSRRRDLMPVDAQYISFQW